MYIVANFIYRFTSFCGIIIYLLCNAHCNIYIYIYIVLSFFLYYVHSLLFVLFVYDMYIVVDSLS